MHLPDFTLPNEAAAPRGTPPPGALSTDGALATFAALFADALRGEGIDADNVATVDSIVDIPARLVAIGLSANYEPDSSAPIDDPGAFTAGLPNTEIVGDEPGVLLQILQEVDDAHAALDDHEGPYDAGRAADLVLETLQHVTKEARIADVPPAPASDAGSSADASDLPEASARVERTSAQMPAGSEISDANVRPVEKFPQATAEAGTRVDAAQPTGTESSHVPPSRLDARGSELHTDSMARPAGAEVRGAPATDVDEPLPVAPSDSNTTRKSTARMESVVEDAGRETDPESGRTIQGATVIRSQSSRDGTPPLPASKEAATESPAHAVHAVSDASSDEAQLEAIDAGESVAEPVSADMNGGSESEQDTKQDGRDPNNARTIAASSENTVDRSSGTTRAGGVPRTVVTAAWLRAMMDQGLRVHTEPEGWNSVTMRLGDEDGTMTVRTKREDGAMTIHVAFSDPALRALATQHVERLEAVLSEQYDSLIDLSLSDAGAEADGRSANDGPAHTAERVTLLTEQNTTTPTRRAPWARHEWVV